MTDRSPLETIQSLYEAFAAGDEATLRELLAPDVEWNQCAGFPGGAQRHGADDVLDSILRGNKTTWVGFAAPVERFVADGDTVVALGAYAGTHSETGLAMRSVFAHVYRVGGGRVVHFDQVADTWPMVAAARGEGLGA